MCRYILRTFANTIMYEAFIQNYWFGVADFQKSTIRIASKILKTMFQT